MLRETLIRIGEDLPKARQQPFGSHPTAQFVRSEGAQALSEALGDLAPGLLCRGSAGAGNWAEVPWLSVFDPIVTDSATKGYYVVYLFSSDQPEVHLSLNQGTTAVRLEFKGQAREVLKDRAHLMRARLSDFVSTFEVYDLNLGSSLMLPRDYEAGHAFGRRYALDNLPPEVVLRKDLQEITRAYLVLTYRGGLDPSPEEPPDQDQTLIEVRRYRMHRRIERNPKASRQAKEFHGTTCQGCTLKFVDMYGPLGDDYIEAHHLKSLSSLQEGVPVTYNVATDFVVLCANCHRMIHRTADPSDFHTFKAMVLNGK